MASPTSVFIRSGSPTTAGLLPIENTSSRSEGSSNGYRLCVPTGVEDGFQVELENGVTYEFKAEFQRWDVVKGTGNSVWITDELPDENYVSNGDLWFDNTEDTMQLFLWHEESGAWLPVAPPTTLEGRVEAGEATQQAIIAQIQESLIEQAKLQNKVNALEGVLGEHSLYLHHD